ncbi:MAG: hypothetical protein WD576_01615 [Nitriliruptoraceae bacterium]
MADAENDAMLGINDTKGGDGTEYNMRRYNVHNRRHYSVDAAARTHGMAFTVDVEEAQ